MPSQFPIQLYCASEAVARNNRDHDNQCGTDGQRTFGADTHTPYIHLKLLRFRHGTALHLKLESLNCLLAAKLITAKNLSAARELIYRRKAQERVFQ
jgi:hypothetical protein